MDAVKRSIVSVFVSISFEVILASCVFVMRSLSHWSFFSRSSCSSSAKLVSMASIAEITGANGSAVTSVSLRDMCESDFVERTVASAARRTSLLTDAVRDGRDLARAEALALRPLVSLGLARRLGVREEGLVAGVLRLEVGLLRLRLGEALGTSAVLAGLVEKRLLRRAELRVLGRHQVRVVRGRRLLSRHRLGAVVRERLEHVREDVLDLAGARRVVLLERRLAVELLPVDLRHVERLRQAVNVALREEALADIHRVLQLTRDLGEAHRSTRSHDAHGLREGRDRLVHLVLGSEVVLVLLLTHRLGVRDRLLEILDLLLELSPLAGQLDAAVGQVVNVSGKLAGA